MIPLARVNEPANELEPTPRPMNLPPAETSVVAWSPKVVFKEPEKELEPTPVELTWPDVLMEAAVREVPTVTDLVKLREPAKELDDNEF